MKALIACFLAPAILAAQEPQRGRVDTSVEASVVQNLTLEVGLHRSAWSGGEALERLGGGIGGGIGLEAAFAEAVSLGVHAALTSYDDAHADDRASLREVGLALHWLAGYLPADLGVTWGLVSYRRGFFTERALGSTVGASARVRHRLGERLDLRVGGAFLWSYFRELPTDALDPDGQANGGQLVLRLSLGYGLR